MKRDEFIRTACTFGVCSLASFGLWAEDRASEQANPNPEVDALKWKLNFVRKRFAKLAGILNADLDENTRNEVFESLGRECAKMFKDLTGQFAGRPEVFL